MSDQDRLRATFQDHENGESVSIVYVVPVEDENVTDYATALATVTECNVVGVRLETTPTGWTPGSGSGGPYALATDMVTLLFQAEDNSSWPVSFSGPDAAIFLADNNTVDPDNAEVGDLIAWILSFCVTVSGSPLVEYIRGWRWNIDAT